MRRLFIVLCAFACLVPRLAVAQAPSGPLQILPPMISPDLRIAWEVKNRFRLFRREADFRRHLAALSLKTILAAEQQMATETDGRGWAAAMLSNLCIDVMGALMVTCERDGARDLSGADHHRIEMRLVGAAPQTTCSWVFDEGDGQPRDRQARAARRCASALPTASCRPSRSMSRCRTGRCAPPPKSGARSSDRGTR